MASVNKVLLLGNLGKDADMRFTASGTPLASFSMATTEKYTTRDGQKKEDTCWHYVKVWGKTAEAIHEFLTKGKQVFVEGKLVTQDYEKDGVRHKSTHINAERVVLLGGGGERTSRPTADSDGAPPSDEDIPF